MGATIRGEMMQKGTKILHKKRGFLATVDKFWEMGDDKPTMVRLFRESHPKIPRWFVFQWPGKSECFDVISEPKNILWPEFRYYIVSCVVKVDTEDEGWDAGCDEAFGLHNICSSPGYDGVCNEDESGARLVDYEVIDKKRFDELKHSVFTKSGGI